MLKGLRSLWSPTAPSGGGSSEDTAKAKDAGTSNGPSSKKDGAGGGRKREGKKQQSKQQQGRGGGSRGGGRGPKGQRQHDEVRAFYDVMKDRWGLALDFDIYICICIYMGAYVQRALSVLHIRID